MAALSAAEAISFSTFTRKRSHFSSLLPSRGPSPSSLPSPQPSSIGKIPHLGQKGQIAAFFLSNSFFPTATTSSSSSLSTKECASESNVVVDEEESKHSTIRRLLLCALVWKALTFISCLACGACLAAVGNSIRASGLGLKVATALRRSGWPDEAIVFALATLPVLELRGAIPVGYWMHLDPLHLTVLSILGNMVPVPFIVLYLKKVASFLSRKSAAATRFVEFLFERAREKAGPVEEFQWLGLMLFVAVPFPGTGAWTGAIIASILDMPFWSAFSANFVGVVFAGLLVNLLMNLGMKYAILTGFLLFFVSSIMWSVLRWFKKSLSSK